MHHKNLKVLIQMLKETYTFNLPLKKQVKLCFNKKQLQKFNFFQHLTFEHWIYNQNVYFLNFVWHSIPFSR